MYVYGYTSPESYFPTQYLHGTVHGTASHYRILLQNVSFLAPVLRRLRTRYVNEYCLLSPIVVSNKYLFYVLFITNIVARGSTLTVFVS